MKSIGKIILFSFLLWNITTLSALLSPTNTVFAFDLDDVVLQKSFSHKGKLVLGGILQNIFTAPDYIGALMNIRKKYQRNSAGVKEDLSDEHGNPINGLTFQFLYHGMRDQRLTPYVSWIVNTMEHSRAFIEGTKKIIEYLKKKNYTIVFATNKDRVSYDITTQALGNEFTTLSTKVFVAHPGNNITTINALKTFAELPTTCQSYKDLEYKARTIQPTEIIFHAPSRKPDLAYFQFMQDIIGTNKNIIFVDDKQENVDGFNELQASTSALRHGIQFDNPLQLAKELIKLGILSKTDDKELLNELRYPGIKGRLLRPFMS